MKIGQSLAPRQTPPTPCPKCGTKVFDDYPNGFVDEIDIISTKSANGFNVKEQWHCPGCGYSETHWHEVDTNGHRLKRANSSQVSKKKRKRQK